MSSKKTNTLFSYFSKSPKNESSSSIKTKTNDTSVNNGSRNNKRKKEVQRNNGNASFDENHHEEVSCLETGGINVYDIVWAKVEGHPWWTGLVCYCPENEGKTFSLPASNKKDGALKYHIQFFDDPPTRAWVKNKFIKIFTGPKHSEIPFVRDPKWKASVDRATEAYDKTVEDRKSLVAVFKSESANIEHNSDVEISENSDDDDTCTPKRKNGHISKSTKKRRIMVISDDESADEYVPSKEKIEESDDSLSAGSVEEEPVHNRKQKAAVKVSKTPKNIFSSKKITEATPLSDVTKSKLFLFSPTVAENSGHNNSDVISNEETNWPHLSKFEFLFDEKIRDAEGRKKSDPDYNPRTLYVPETFKKTLTPAMKQWWDIKSKHFDVVLFYKVGKFYELYHMDAVIGVNELGFTYMKKDDFAHSGFPEKSYGHFAELLIQKGYQVGRVEQTETPLMMEKRCEKISKPTKYDKVVRRELCRVTSLGTRTYSFLETQTSDSKNCYLLALTEKADLNTGESVYGICFIDTSIGQFHFGQFTDDRNCSRLRTLISHYPPTQVLYEKLALSSKTLNILENCLSFVIKNALKPGSEFWEATDTLKVLKNKKYFENERFETIWPESLLEVIDQDDPLYQTANEAYELAVKSLGACIFYLQYSQIDDEIITMKKFEKYSPPDEKPGDSSSTVSFSKYMVLDGATLLNLEVVGSDSGSSEGSLLDTMDYCSTPFGKRLFHQWLCAPLCNIQLIEDRLDAVEYLRENSAIMDDIIPLLKQIPDLQRLLSKIHTQGSKRRSEEHPDSRATFYEEKIYSKKKIEDFLLTLQGFHTCLDIINMLQNSEGLNNSRLLKECVQFTDNDGHFPQIEANLQYFRNAFDHEEAKREGKIIPNAGVDNVYDEAVSEISSIQAELDQYLEKQKRHFGCQIVYFGTGKNRYQLEVPDHASKKATAQHDVQGSRKGFKRYWTSTIKEHLENLILAEDKCEAALKDIMRSIFAKFDDHIQKWEAAIDCISILDVLLSFTQYSLNTGTNMCRPKVTHCKNEPFLEIRNGRHPALLKLFQDEDLVANDILIGENNNSLVNSNLVLVTGPNMGGKSTLMREAGLLVIMAQMGSFVPAEVCHFSKVDRIFTRLGANDQIMDGESTFFVELSETVSILQHATTNSLVLMDELGRGTATFDGSAIAYSVVHELSDKIGCRTLFSTHYHSLVDEFSQNSKIKLGHMSCMVETDDKDADQENITFLYKFADGSCPKSYGFNAAKLAGIPDEVIKVGRQKAQDFEKSLNRIKYFRCLLMSSDIKGTILKIRELC